MIEPDSQQRSVVAWALIAVFY